MALAASVATPPEVRFGAATLPSLLHRAKTADTGLVFCEDAGDHSLPFSELADRAAAAGSVLRSLGVGRGDRVCLLSSTSPALVTALWGVWCADAVPVVLSLPRRMADAASYPGELSRRVEQADARLLLVADEFAPLLDTDSVSAKVVTLGRLDRPAIETYLAEPVSEPDDLALLQFTSGTTARSRAVALTHRQLLSNLSAFSDALGLSPADSGVSWLPLYHDMGILNVVAAVAHPGRLVLLRPEDFVTRPACWLDAVSRFRATITVAPNMAYALATRHLQLRPNDDLDLSSLRVAGNGAEPIDAQVLAEFVEQAAKYGFAAEALCPMYGLAEATLAVSISPTGTPPREVWVSRPALETERVARPMAAHGPDARRFVACGPPVPGTEIDIRDGGDSVPDGKVGEIWIRSPSTMSGYWCDEEATATVLRDGWLDSGDLGFVHDGELVVCGRAKDMIVVAGRNLYPEDYEQLAATRSGIRRGNVIAFGLPDTERMVLVAETPLRDDPARRLAADVLRMVTQELSRAPEEVILVAPGTLPKTSSGKIQRGFCRGRYIAGDLPAVATAVRR